MAKKLSKKQVTELSERLVNSSMKYGKVADVAEVYNWEIKPTNLMIAFCNNGDVAGWFATFGGKRNRYYVTRYLLEPITVMNGKQFTQFEMRLQSTDKVTRHYLQYDPATGWNEV